MTILTALLIMAIWVENLGDLSVTLGLLAAGLAFALQEVIGSIAGWTTILSRRPFVIGDRIETGGIRGDVVDISMLRTTLMEIGKWMGGDHNTGRIVTVSSAFIFKEPLFNHSQHLHVDTDSRRVFLSEISQRILTDFAAGGIVVASQTVSIVQFPSARTRGRPTLSESTLEESWVP